MPTRPEGREAGLYSCRDDLRKAFALSTLLGGCLQLDDWHGETTCPGTCEQNCFIMIGPSSTIQQQIGRTYELIESLSSADAQSTSNIADVSIKDTEVELLPEYLLEQDIFVAMPPKRQYLMKVRVAGRERGKPNVIEPDTSFGSTF